MSVDTSTPSIKGAWALLRAQGRNADEGLEVPTWPTDVRTALGSLRLALGKSGEPRMLLPIPDRESVTNLEETPALSISTTFFTHMGVRIRFLDVTCLSKDLEVVFEEVAGEILSRVSSGASCKEAIHSTLRDFRSLLRQSSQDVIETTRVVGLVAELLVVNRLLDRSALAWRSWSGPAKDRHDFRLGSTSLEVKASLRLSNPSITIHGLDQLEAPSDGTLHLVRLVLEPVASGPLSVSSLGNTALSKAQDPEQLRELISQCGCEDIDAAHWNRQSFRLDSEFLYEISHGFPRLTSSMIEGGGHPAGVSQISYSIDLTMATGFLRDRNVYVTIEKELARCS